MTAERAKLFERAFDDGLHDSFAHMEPAALRIIAIKESIQAQCDVLTFEDVEDHINKADSIAFADCVCRTIKEKAGKPCPSGAPTKEMCIVLGPFADYYEKTGRGRKVNKEEAKVKLREAAAAGLIHETFNVQEGSPFICNCCGCCCTGLRMITDLKQPNVVVEISAADCVGCGACVERCHLHALALREGDLELSTERCVGCGVCTSFCPTSALSMRRKVEQVSPPNDMVTLAADAEPSLHKYFSRT
jgi:Fe-S-cluster-containing hydrogenase component 2